MTATAPAAPWPTQPAAIDLAPVPVLTDPVPGATVLTAVLQVRTGYSDETWTTSGWTHLIEHAVLEALPDQPRCRNNGMVAPALTTLTLTGEPAAVREELGLLSGLLVTPPTDGFASQLRTLAAERALRPNATVSQILSWRYGAAGVGLAGYDEPGLHAVNPPALVEFARIRFTAHNSVLLLTGAVDGPIEFLLPNRQPQVPAPLVDLSPSGRAWFVMEGQHVAVQGFVPPGPETEVLIVALRERLTRQLRMADRLSYSPDAVAVAIDPGRDALSLVVDATENPEATLQATLAVIGTLQRDGFDPAELAEIRRVRTSHRADARNSTNRLMDQIEQQLRGSAMTLPPMQAPELFELWTRSLVVAVPPGVAPPPGHDTQEPLVVPGRARGTVHRSLEWSLRRRIVTSPGFLHLPARKGHRPIELAKAQGMTISSDGGVTLIDQQGYGSRFECSLYTDPVGLHHHLTAGVPADRIVWASPRRTEQIPVPRSTKAQLTDWVTDRFVWLVEPSHRALVFWMTLLVLCLLVGLVLILNGVSSGFYMVAPAVITGICAALTREKT